VILVNLLINLPIKVFGYFNLVTNLREAGWLAIAYEVRTRIIGLDGDIFIPELI
jgi:hypothetical protein